MKDQDFTIPFLVDQTPEEVFDAIAGVRRWWSGLYSEEIQGSSKKLNDEFTFRAGGGAHYSKQKLVEIIPGKKIVWLVTDSNLTFLDKKEEWTGTKLCFEMVRQETKTQVRFTHVGLIREMECYGSCSVAWRQYWEQFLSSLADKDKI